MDKAEVVEADGFGVPIARGPGQVQRPLESAHGPRIVEALLIIDADIVQGPALFDPVMDERRELQTALALLEERREVAHFEMGQGQLTEALHLEVGEAELAAERGRRRQAVEGPIIELRLPVGPAEAVKADDLETGETELARAKILAPAEEPGGLLEMPRRFDVVTEVPLENAHPEETPAGPGLITVLTAESESSPEDVVRLLEFAL